VVAVGRAGSAAAALALALAAAAGCSPGGRTFDAERAWAHLVAQVEAGPRVPGSDGHRATLAYLRAHLEARADRVLLHELTETSPLDSTEMRLTNVVAVFGAESTTRLLFGAHWDTRPVADREEADSLRALPVPGANDGASGVAVLLEVAEALSRREPRVGVDLVFFDGEDSGRNQDPRSFALGSQGFVRDHPAYRPRIAVILDMVGRRDARIPREGNSVRYAGRAVESVWGAARDLGLTALVDSVGPPTFDDHIAFLVAGIPAVDILDLRDPAWHTTRDLPENCSPETLDQIGRLVLELIARAEAGE
jgi:hypothetical protein